MKIKLLFHRFYESLFKNFCPIVMSDRKSLRYSEKRRLGNLGEDIVEMFLVKRGYKIIDRNYLKKWGELDIVAKHNNEVVFFEVKSKVTRENRGGNNMNVSRTVSHDSFTANDFDVKISREMDGSGDEFSPSENVHTPKLKRIYRAIQSYCAEKRVSDNQEWRIDVIIVVIDFLKKEAIINHIENIVID